MATLAELIRRFRLEARDNVQPNQLISDEDITMWLNDAQREAAIRGRLIRDSATLGVAKIPIEAGRTLYQLHPAVVEIIAIRRYRGEGKRGHPLYLRSVEWMDRHVSDWREDPHRYRHDNFVIQTDTGLELVNDDYDAGDLIWLDCYRLPLEPLRNPGDVPEIHPMHHEQLVHWALHKAFSIPDVELIDPTRADKAERAFTKYFGRRPDSDARRSTRTDEVQHNYPML